MNDYGLMLKQVKELRHPDWVAYLSNVSALLNENMTDINWVGFYLVKNEKLILGPFQGKVACTDIEYGKGVCGTAWKENEIQLVEDVHKFKGHIACDSASNSEIVIPIHNDGDVVGVLDIDSPLFSRFNEDDKNGLSEIVKELESSIVW